MTELGKQVWKKMEEMGWENAPEGFHLEYFENIIECTKQVLTITDVVDKRELLIDFLNFAQNDCGTPFNKKSESIADNYINYTNSR